METLLAPDGSLAALFAACFLAATLVPLSSEAALFAVLKLHPELFWAALVAATAGNTAGGMTTYVMGRWFAREKPLTQLDRVRRWGAPLTALGWLPLLGDALCLAAGWLKLSAASVLLWQGLGRFARYWMTAHASMMM